jgi:hypothetical protein
MLALLLSAAAGSALSSSGETTRAAGLPEVCRATEVAKSLDFWVGNWNVYVGSQLAGHDRVERELHGCGIIERWSEADGSGDGISLFAFDARKQIWTQTWVTDNSGQPGGIKYKVLRARGPGTTTFQGEIEGMSGAVYYDRTILSALADGRVRQQIQVSRNGADWQTAFDAIYVQAAHSAKDQ